METALQINLNFLQFLGAFPKLLKDLLYFYLQNQNLILPKMMLTSNPYFILMKPNTLEVINKIWEYREATNSNICFTLDAGANVHVLFPGNEKSEVLNFIENELSMFCQKNHYICDYTGLGAREL